ncbi:sugar phosphate nucleotidyltransferase [Roseovarius tibetensis]|uniref:sugar phosphate nucleotidyltransferase n=1 Tax=Roseovarius tibetensis TaxID=2685897 RepID=UPI003D7F42B6
MARVTRAVFPVIELGTRFLPATKAMPKGLLPIINKPIIQYPVEDAIAADITDLIFVTGRTKRAALRTVTRDRPARDVCAEMIPAPPNVMPC